MHNTIIKAKNKCIKMLLECYVTFKGSPHSHSHTHTPFLEGAFPFLETLCKLSIYGNSGLPFFHFYEVNQWFLNDIAQKFWKILDFKK